MKPAALCFSLLSCLAFVQCEKSNPFTVDMTQITAVDALGNPTGTADPTDWAADATWSETETAFFRTDPVDLSGSSVTTVTMKPATPNPTQARQVTLLFTTDTVTFIRIAVVDQQLYKKGFFQFKTDPGLNAFNIPLPAASFPANAYYRIYYSFDAPGKPFYYKGHGDILLKD